MKAFVTGILAAGSVIVASPALANTFEGPYVGAQAGWNHDFIRDADTDIGTLVMRGKRNSFNGGVFAGYNYKATDKVVIGAEAGFGMGATDYMHIGSNVVDPNHSFDVSARAGYLVTPKTLVYVRGGYDNMRATVSDGVLTGHKTFDGWSIGGGVERALLDNVSARLDYRYSDLGNHGNRFARNRVLVGVAYNF